MTHNSEVPDSLHVVFGAGQVGQPLAQQLRDRGMRVRLARRSASAQAPPGCELAVGDAMDPAFCRDATRGATVVYNCMNPPYDTAQWAAQIPRFTENLIAAAGGAGARLVVLDNLYMLAPPRGRRLDENSPVGPVSRKGIIRARAAERVAAAHRAGEVTAVTGRASDFYGPGGTMTGLGDFFWPRALAGKRVYSPYPLDAVHTYHYIPDVAAALVELGCADPSACGQVWMLPCRPAESMRALLGRIQEVLGRDIKAAQMPRLLVKALSVAVPVMRELHEMLYQWDEPFVVDDGRFRARFGLEPATADQAARATVEWALNHYGTGGAARASG